MYLAARSYWPLLNSRAPARRYSTGGTGEDGRAAVSAAGVAPSARAPRVNAPDAPRAMSTVIVLNLPNATSFHRPRKRPPTSLTTVPDEPPRRGCDSGAFARAGTGTVPGGFTRMP